MSIREMVAKRKKQLREYIDAIDPNISADKKYRTLAHQMDVNYNTLKNFYAGSNTSIETMCRIDEYFEKKEQE